MFRSRVKRGYIAAAAFGAAALAVGATAPSASAASGASTYDVHPLMHLGFPASQATPAQLPAPSVCEATFGLACYGPQDFRTAYNVPASATGAGQTIVIVDAYGSPTIQSDLATYDAFFGLPAPPAFNIIYPGGKPAFNPQNNHDESSWASETSLDVEQAHGLAPDATIDLVVAANNGGDVLDNAVKYAVDNHLGNVLSMSFGEPEDLIHGNSDHQNQFHSIFTSGVADGMSFFASAGDSGATGGTSTTTASYPASDPLVTAVGGTNLFLADDGTYQSEDVWNDGDDCPFGCTAGEFGATGGAPSTLFTAPSYQSGVTGYSSRAEADVSFNASVYTATMIYQSFPGTPAGLYFFGGTSEGSPSWAALTADADQAAGHSLGQLNPLLYKIYGNSAAYAADFHDVTVGDNAFNGAGFAAKVGYDLPTGIGTPNVANLITSLTAGL